MTNLLSPQLPVVALVLIAMCGCGRPEGTVGAPALTEAVSQELSWAEQISAVRSAQHAIIRMTTVPVSEEQWRDLAEGCDALTDIDVETVDAPPASLSILSSLPQLRQLRIGSEIDDAGLRHIAQTAPLRVLNLPQGRFTDAGLARLSALPRLELLRFHSPHVTDEGLKRIAELPALRFLHLINVPITDDGLTHLYGLDRLESFYLDGGRCTADGLSRLLKRLPDLHFHYNQLHLPDDPHAHPHGGD
jgi:hypothetical protein